MKPAIARPPLVAVYDVAPPPPRPVLFEDQGVREPFGEAQRVPVGPILSLRRYVDGVVVSFV